MKSEEAVTVKTGNRISERQCLGVWNRFLQSRCFFEGLEIDRIWQESQLKVFLNPWESRMLAGSFLGIN